jgi:hypothetical protein
MRPDTAAAAGGFNRGGRVPWRPADGAAVLAKLPFVAGADDAGGSRFVVRPVSAT